jgi:hypothetical protein
MEIINEISYLCKYHLDRLNETITNFEKTIPYKDKTGPAEVDLSVMGDNISITGSSKFKNREYSSAKNMKDITNSLIAPIIPNFSAKKRNRPSKQKSKEKEDTEELTVPQYADTVIPEFDQKNEPKYCFCNEVSYGDMIKCDNEKVFIYFIIH